MLHVDISEGYERGAYRDTTRGRGIRVALSQLSQLRKETAGDERRKKGDGGQSNSLYDSAIVSNDLSCH